MNRYRIVAAVVLSVSIALGWFVWSTRTPDSPYAFKLGLDLAGGTELVYKADMSHTAPNERVDSLSALRGVIERRVNLFGVAEPLVQTEHSSAVAKEQEYRLIVDLPGVTNIKAAVDALGKTPVLDFRLATTTLVTSAGSTTRQVGFISTGLTGRYLQKASLQFGSSQSNALGQPVVLLKFNKAGAKLFEKITKNNIGHTLAIFLDGQPISTPTIKEAIPGGTASISGNFTVKKARDLVQNLNFGALPVPIKLQSSSSVGPTLGAAAIHDGLKAGIIGFAIVVLFMILWYRLPGLIASIALSGYLALVLSVMKIIPITLTVSGIAGLILSVGMAVDANVLIFERIKEELRNGEGAREATHIGFARAWPAIRDGHVTMLISSIVLFWIGTSIVQGFALTFALGVLASLISAVSASRVLLLAVLPEGNSGVWSFLTNCGLHGRVSISDSENK
ncbi:Protein translocase subunit SecD [hydrothermal vent metagenome]|uniref:Protein translocase subunit SecD n=1 Tax=hydrothermal vent metagenome TaxID=652676 RepID=A0A3B0V2S1_9ZZZZ